MGGLRTIAIIASVAAALLLGACVVSMYVLCEAMCLAFGAV